ncbi:NAD(P)-binding domain-containing protein [Patescibacteria group bacterium]
MKYSNHNIIIIGAGIHATAVGAAIRSKYPDRKLTIIDPNPFLYDWNRRTLSIGMRSMRSPWSHTLFGDENDLHALSETNAADKNDLLPLEAFTAHARDIIEKFHLEQNRIPARVESITQNELEGYTLSLTNNHPPISVNRLILAIGLGQPRMPSIKGIDIPEIYHADNIDIRKKEWQDNNLDVLIIGGGLTAGTLAVRLAEKGIKVTIAIRRDVSIEPFDFDEKWFGGSIYKQFRQANLNKRLDMLTHGLMPGTITRECYDHILRLVKNGKIRILERTAVSKFSESGSKIRAHRKLRPKIGDFDQVICATGYKADFDQYKLLSPNLREKVQLIDGYPVIKDSLELLPGVFVSGALAKLGIGAAATNIYGARLAADIICENI